MRDRLRTGAPVVGTWVSLSDPAVAELVAPDFDFVVLDREHTPHDLATITDQARAVDAASGDAVPLARVPANDPVAIKRTLDVGVAGVVVPSVESREEAEAAVAACRYPPDGMRGVAAARAAQYGRTFDEYVAGANEDVLTVLQIETEGGVGNAAAIAAVDGVDALFVGPADLSADLGAIGEFDDSAVREAVRDVLDAGSASDIPVGTLCTGPDQVRTLGGLGFDFLVAGLDTAFLLEGATTVADVAADVLE